MDDALPCKSSTFTSNLIRSWTSFRLKRTTVSNVVHYQNRFTDNERAVIDSEVQKRAETKKKELAVEKLAKELFEQRKSNLGAAFNLDENKLAALEAEARKEAESKEIDTSNIELDKKELKGIEKIVQRELEYGDMEIGAVEQTVLKELSDEYNALGEEAKTATPERVDEIRARQKTIKSEMREAVKGDQYLTNILDEAERKTQIFHREAKKTDTEKTRALYKSAVEAGMSNSKDMHSLFDIIDGVQNKSSNTEYRIVNSKQLATMDYTEIAQGVCIINRDDGTVRVLINIDAKDGLETVTVHEAFHPMKGTKGFDKVIKFVKEFLEMRGEYKAKYDAIAKTYEAYKDVNLEEEVTTRTIAEHLSDDKFLAELARQDSNVFYKLYDEVKHLFKMATARSPEARKLEQIKHAFKKALGEVSAETIKAGKTDKSIEVHYALEDIEKMTPKAYNNHGWAKVHDVLDNVELADYMNKCGTKERAGGDWYLNLGKGRHMFAVGHDGINNTIVIGNGNYANPSIEKVYRIGLDNETDIEIVRDVIYDSESSSEWSLQGASIEEIFRDENVGIYTVHDFENYREVLQRYERAKSEGNSGNNSRLQDGSGSNSNIEISEPLKETDKTSSVDDVFFKYTVVKDNKGRELTESQKRQYKNVSSKLKDEFGNIKTYYHGTSRGDRVGNYFDPKRATSGPMAYFTDDPEIAGRYSKDKADTSIAYDSEYDSYETQFRVERDGEDMSVIDLWYRLSPRERAEIKEKGKHITLDDDWENVVYDEEQQRGLGNYDSYELNRHKGNALATLVSSWLTDGNIYGEERKFLDVLKMVGIEDARYMNPNHREEKVFEVYLNVTNPFDTADVDEGFLADVYKWLDETDLSQYEKETANADMWDKNSTDPYKWTKRLKDDVENGTTHAWTSIPDVITDFLKTQGYDGIVDAGGKSGGVGHQVVIPFYSEQIKDVSNQNPTNDPHIDMSLPTSDDVAPIGKYFGKDLTQKTGEELNSTYLSDIAPIRDDIPAQPTKTEAPANTEQDEWDEFDSIFDGETTDTVESPFDDRDIKDVGKRSVNAYMYDNPEVKPYFQFEAEVMLYDLKHSTKGERIMTGSYETGQEWTGVKRATSPEIEDLLDNYNYSYADIEKGLNAIIKDHGAENIAVAKRIEFWLDERLREGYTDWTTGQQIEPNQEYIDLLKQKQTENVAPTAEDIAPIKQDVAPVENATEDIAPIREDAPKPVKGKERKWVGTSTGSAVVDGAVLPEDLDKDKITYEPIPNKKTLGNANARLDRYGYEASVVYFNSQFENKRTSLDDIALGERLIQEAINRNDTKTAGELIQNIAILGTELGQKVQALSIIKKLTPAGQLRMLEKTIERGKTKEDKAFEGVEMTQEMRDKILKAYNKDGTYDQNKLNAAVEEVKQMIANQMKVTVGEKVNSWRYLSMLGNPKTHIRNIVSNVAMRGTLTVKNAMARTIEDIAPIKSRTKTWKPASKEVKDFAKQTAVEMKDVLKDGGKYSEETSIKAKRAMFKNKVLNAVYKFNTDMLSREDWWFSRPAFQNALKEYLTANGIQTKQDIENNPEVVEKAKAYATEQSQIATFRQYSWLANKISELEKKNLATGIAFGSVIPFKKTPVNIAKTGLNYSPLGFAKTLTYDIAEVKKGNMEASTLIDHISQNTVGSALALAGYMLAQMGILTGSGDDDEEAKYDYQLGKQSYALKLGDTTYSLSWLTPVAMPLLVGANAYEQLVEGKEWNPDVVMQTLAQTLDPMSEMSFMSSLDDVLSSYDSGVQKFAGIVTSMGQNYATQFVPTLSSQVATVMDDTKRSTKVAANSGFKMFDETINKLKYKIPGLRETLEPSTDIWGNEVKQTENMFERTFESFIAPYTRKESIATFIDDEIKDLYSQTGDSDLIPDIPKNYINYNGNKYKLSAKEYTEYKKIYGQTANDLLEDLFRNSSYQQASVEEQAKMVNEVYDYAADKAKRKLLTLWGITYSNASYNGIPLYKENSIKGAIENDMLLEEFDFKLKNPERYELLKENNVSYAAYNSSEEIKKAYDWASEYPEKYEVSKVITDDVIKYKEYSNTINDFDAKNSRGETVKGLKKSRAWNYIDSLDLNYAQKLILFKSHGFSISDNECRQVLYYLYSIDMTDEERKTTLKELDFKFKSNGEIEW